MMTGWWILVAHLALPRPLTQPRLAAIPGLVPALAALLRAPDAAPDARANCVGALLSLASHKDNQVRPYPYLARV